jgi:hypothetical protein
LTHLGYGKIAAAFFYYIAFATVPNVLNVIIPAMTEVMKEEYVYIVISIATLASVFIIWNVAMMFVYKCKLPFFEQYRINPQVYLTSLRSHGLGSRTIKIGKSCSLEAFTSHL